MIINFTGLMGVILLLNHSLITKKNRLTAGEELQLGALQRIATTKPLLDANPVFSFRQRNLDNL